MNPFSARLAKAKKDYAKLLGVNSHDQAMAKSFPLGAGSGSRVASEKQTNASLDRSIKLIASKQAVDYLEMKTFAWDHPEKINKVPKPQNERDEILYQFLKMGDEVLNCTGNRITLAKVYKKAVISIHGAKYKYSEISLTKELLERLAK